jgi:hypothetical protein
VLVVDQVTALRRRCAELEGELQAKSLLEAGGSRLEREKVKLTDRLSKAKLEKNAAVEYMKGSHAELSVAKLEIENIHTMLRVAELIAERESSEPSNFVTSWGSRRTSNGVMLLFQSSFPLLL